MKEKTESIKIFGVKVKVPERTNFSKTVYLPDYPAAEGKVNEVCDLVRDIIDYLWDDELKDFLSYGDTKKERVKNAPDHTYLKLERLDAVCR